MPRRAKAYYSKDYTSTDSCTIYFIKAPSGHVKIGSTHPTKLRERIAELQVGNHQQLELIRIIENASREQEAWLHKQFKNFRIRGEWFKFTEEMLTVIIDLESVKSKTPLRKRVYDRDNGKWITYTDTLEVHRLTEMTCPKCKTGKLISNKTPGSDYYLTCNYCE